MLGRRYLIQALKVMNYDSPVKLRLWLEQYTTQTAVEHLFSYMQVLHPSVLEENIRGHGTSG